MSVSISETELPVVSLIVSGDSAFKAAVEYIFFGPPTQREKAKPNSNPRWGVLPPSRDSESFCRNWIALIQAGCREFVQIGEDSDLPPEVGGHRFLKPLIGASLHFVANLQELVSLIALKQSAPAEMASVFYYLQAMVLQGRLERFSHGREKDVVNRFLAPARLLGAGIREIEKATWKTLWESFTQEVLTEEARKLPLGRELIAASDPISQWLANSEPKQLNDEELERMMLIFTQIRLLAGQTAKPGQRTQQVAEVSETNKLLKEPEPLKILVIDDHADAWRPVFDKIAAQIKAARGHLLEIAYSLEGKKVCGTGELVSGGGYDVVILDVFLGSTNGLDILHQLRRDFSQLPVLLWTTSRDEEITSPAVLANGVLLKKTVTENEMREVIYRWALRGSVMRKTILPNPFFNHTIISPDLRKLAVDSHEWCLRQLDSFHALDNVFFRYFTDHGGRHIIKLLELWVQVLQPFLGQTDHETPVLPEAHDEREFEITGMYLAVMCHELGMFPMKIGGRVEDFSTAGQSYLEDVRALHAVRGMVLLEDRERRFWNDDIGAELGKRLLESNLAAPEISEHKLSAAEQEKLEEITPTMADRVAVMVGYHARVFKSLEAEFFLKWDEKSTNSLSSHKSLFERLKKLKSPTPTLSSADAGFASAFQKLDRKFSSDPEARERLRRQCALFRFVDALDLSHSRNSAEFLSGERFLHPVSYRERFKRELCDIAEIKNRRVLVKMNVSKPTENEASTLANHLNDSVLKNDNVLKKAESFKSGMISDPWLRSRESKGDWTPQDIAQSLFAVHKDLDEWLVEVWKVLISRSGDAAFLKDLRRMRVLDPVEDSHPTLRPEGAQIIAWITAISVAGEILDEYRAVCDVNLQSYVQIGNSSWVWEKTSWLGKVPKRLSTLQRFLTADKPV